MPDRFLSDPYLHSRRRAASTTQKHSEDLAHKPAIAFRIFKGMLEKKYGKDGAAKRIYATTDCQEVLLLHSLQSSSLIQSHALK